MRQVKLGIFLKRMPAFDRFDPTAMSIGMRAGGEKDERNMAATAKLSYYYINDKGWPVRIARPSIAEMFIASLDYMKNPKRKVAVGGRDRCPLE